MKDKLLALDISSKATGWAVFEDGKLVDYGVIEIAPKNTWAFRLSVFAEELTSILKSHEPTHVIIEDIYRGPNAMTFKVLAFFHGVAYATINTTCLLEPELIGVLSARSTIGKAAEVTCKTKDQAFFIINSTLKLGLDFKTGNDIADACALAYGYMLREGIKPKAKLRFNRASYEKIGVKKNGSVQSTRGKKKRNKRGSKKSVSKTRAQVSSRQKSRK